MSHTPSCDCIAASVSEKWKCALDCPGCTCGLLDKTLGKRTQSPNLCRVGKQHCVACAEKDAEILLLRLLVLEKEAEKARYEAEIARYKGLLDAGRIVWDFEPSQWGEG